MSVTLQMFLLQNHYKYSRWESTFLLLCMIIDTNNIILHQGEQRKLLTPDTIASP